MIRRFAFASTVALLLSVPFFAHAFPFGGKASIVLDCVYNSTIYVNLGPPRGGEYVWTTATRTYQFGPPRYAGQWLLGLAGAPYYCIYKISPLTIYTAIAITMMGSSGPAAPAAPPTRGPTLPGPTPSPTPGPTPTPTPTPPGPTPPPSPGPLDHLVISEVYYSVDAARGAKPRNEWIEIYNGTQAAVSLASWKIEDALVSDVIPGSLILAPGKFLVISATSTTRALWNLPPEVPFTSLGNPIGDGLSNAGDRILLRNASGAVVDAVSWGTNTTAMSPSVPVVSYGQSMARGVLSRDTNTASDWVSRATPTPGRQ